MNDASIPPPWRHPNVRRVLDFVEPVKRAFDPTQAWTHAYHIHFLNIRAKRGRGKAEAAKGGARAVPPPDGSLSISFTPGQGGVRLDVEALALMNGDRTIVRIDCAEDRLVSPREWTTEFTAGNFSASDLGALKTGGAVKNGVWMRDGRAVKGGEGLTAWSCDWSLFAAVQRLAAEGVTEPVEFTLLEYLDMRRDGQRLVCRGETRVDCGGVDMPAVEYVHFGPSSTPTHYYVDPRGRLFLALGTRRLFTLKRWPLVKETAS